MSDEPEISDTKMSEDTAIDPAKPPRKTLPLPGMAGIALYMLAIATVIGFAVMGHHVPPIFLLVAILTACGSYGLARQKRWGWALALAATFLLMIYQFFLLLRFHQGPAGLMGALNLVLFLYLVRPEVLERLK